MNAMNTLEITADVLIAAAYFTIPVQLLVFLKSTGSSLPRGSPIIVLLFATFIIMCGTTHLFTCLDNAYSWPTALLCLKVGTAFISWVTALALLKVIPASLALPAYTAKLEKEVKERLLVEEGLRAEVYNNSLLRIAEHFRGIKGRTDIVRRAAVDVAQFATATRSTIILPPGHQRRRGLPSSQALRVIAWYRSTRSELEQSIDSPVVSDGAMPLESMQPLSLPRRPSSGMAEAAFSSNDSSSHSNTRFPRSTTVRQRSEKTLKNVIKRRLDHL